MAETQTRFEVLRLDGKPRTTPQGFLRYDANLTRTGVLTYRDQSGKTWRELRHPDEVFRDDSMQSIAAAPLTDLHPGLVTPSNVREHQIGVVGESVRRDGRFLRGTVTVQDATAIDRVTAGQRRELSPGYTATIDATPGEHDGERYDTIQRKITYNHVGIGPEGWGRSGSEVSLRFDGAVSDIAPPSRLATFLSGRMRDVGISAEQLAEAVRCDESDLEGWFAGLSEPSAEQCRALGESLDVRFDALLALTSQGRPTPKPTRTKKPMATIRIDGIDYEADSAATQPALDKWQAKYDGEIATLKQRAEKAEGERDQIKSDKDKLQAKYDAAVDPKALEAAVAERTAVESGARKLLGDAEAKFDGLSNREVREKALKHAHKDIVLDGKSDDYVDARFDAAVEAAPAKRDDAASKGRRASFSPPTEGGDNPEDRYDAEAARARMYERNKTAWQTGNVNQKN